jgi:inorganic pyrophosphatase
LSIDYNTLLGPGNLPEINTVIEIPQGSTLKIEYRRDLGIFELDRVEPKIFAKPVNYGFIPGSLDDDGDELDTLVVCAEPLPMGLYLRARVIGVLNFEDDGEMDHKVICVPAEDHGHEHIQTVADLGERWAQEVEHHFKHYKDFKKGETKVLGYGTADDAAKIIGECIERYQQSK